MRNILHHSLGWRSTVTLGLRSVPALDSWAGFSPCRQAPLCRSGVRVSLLVVYAIHAARNAPPPPTYGMAKLLATTTTEKLKHVRSRLFIYHGLKF